MAIDGEKFNDISDSIVLHTNSYKNAFHNVHTKAAQTIQNITTKTLKKQI